MFDSKTGLSGLYIGCRGLSRSQLTSTVIGAPCMERKHPEDKTWYIWTPRNGVIGMSSEKAITPGNKGTRMRSLSRARAHRLLLVSNLESCSIRRSGPPSALIPIPNHQLFAFYLSPGSSFLPRYIRFPPMYTPSRPTSPTGSQSLILGRWPLPDSGMPGSGSSHGAICQY